MVDEFDFFRKVRASYCNVPFLIQLSYKISHRVSKRITARGVFGCRVNPHTQIVEYRMQLRSDPVARPFSEKGALLFSTVYEEIPSQIISIDDCLIYSKRYSIPIDFDWQAFVIEGAETAFKGMPLRSFFKNWRFTGRNGEAIDGLIKVENAAINWST